jgi:uncharacterized short protein YbdD (DUF466 family)
MLDSGAAGQRGGGAVLARLAFVLRRISGMPDYAEYVEHLHRCHPETPVPSERDFYAEFIRRRYEDGPTRCC